MHRRLPVYLLIDTSFSMEGEAIEAVRNGLDTLVRSLRKDPHALETAHLSVIEFNSEATQLEGLRDLAEFRVPTLKPKGTTAMGAALSLLADCVERDVLQAGRRDWRPLVFLFTDGMASDKLDPGIAAIRRVKLGTLVACAAGPIADVEELKRVTAAIVRLDHADSASITSFFKWVSASVATGSQRVETGGPEASGLGDLPPPPPEVNIIDLTKH